MSLADVIGWAGALALLAAYALLGWDRLRPTSIGYIGLNLAGSAGLAVNGVVHGAWPSTALNLLWLLIALVGWRRRHRAARRTADTRLRRRDGGPLRPRSGPWPPRGAGSTLS